MQKKPLVREKKSLNELEVLGRRLDAVRGKLAICDAQDTWKRKFFQTVQGQLLREWQHSINDYDNSGYRYCHAGNVNSVRVISDTNSNSLNR